MREDLSVFLSWRFPEPEALGDRSFSSGNDSAVKTEGCPGHVRKCVGCWDGSWDFRNSGDGRCDTRQPGLAKRGSWEAQEIALLFPIQWQALEPLQMRGGEFQRLPAGYDGLDNVGRKEC